MTCIPNGVSRLPKQVQALLAYAAFLIVGIAVLDDYGAGFDAGDQRQIAIKNLDFMLAQAESLREDHTRFYGVAFELPLLLVERILGLEDVRDIILSRHLLTHMLFLAAALSCLLLTYRMFNNRLLAFLALLLFVLHPRLYAQSFYNSKDLPFLSMFMITLYLTHRAFRKDTLWAFVILGVGVGILVNLRIMGIMLFSAILAMRALDLLLAKRRTQHVVATGSAFTIASGCTLYAVSPYLWVNPLELLTALQELGRIQVNPSEMFQGNSVSAHHLPSHFIPTWIAISTPPVALLLTAIGAMVICTRGVAQPLEALTNTELRFGILLICLLSVPLVVVVLVNASMYDAWRHMFFLYAPMCLLAMIGLHWINATMKKLPNPWKTGSYALVGVGMAVTAAEMIRIHPHQHAYFNLLVDRKTPEHLRTQYEMDPRGDSCREGLAYLLQLSPTTTIRVLDGYSISKGHVVFPKEERERLMLVQEGEDFRIICGKMLHEASANISGEAVFSKKLYNSTILRIEAAAIEPNLELARP